MWELYDSLIDGVASEEKIDDVIIGSVWTYVKVGTRCGIAMTTPGTTRPPFRESGNYRGMPLCEAAKLIKSWNFIEASVGMAAINVFYNTSDHMEELGALQPGHQFCTAGIDVQGKRIGMVGHLRMADQPLAGAKEIRILERRPQVGDYPDSACEYVLSDCDMVIITGNAFTNKTMPKLLQICKGCPVILTGPSVPLTPALFSFGASRLAGLILTDMSGMKNFAETGTPGPPYSYGQRFCLDLIK